MNAKAKDLSLAGLLGGIHFFALSPILSLPLNQALGDSFLKKYLVFFRNALLHFHQFPLWNDFLGIPFVEIPTTRAFYPLFWIASLLHPNPEIGCRVFTLFHLLLWGPSFYFLMRYGLHCGRAGSFLASAGMIWSPLFLAGLFNGYVTENTTAPFLFVSLGFFLRGLWGASERPWRATFYAGFFLGVLFLAGGSFLYLYAVLFYVCLIVVFSLLLLFEKKGGWRELFLNGAKVAFVFGVSFATAAIQFFSSYFFMSRDTARPFQTYEAMVGQVVPWVHYVGDFLNAFPYGAAAVWLGLFWLIPLWLRGSGRKQHFLFLILFGLFFWITLGRACAWDLYYWIHHWVPGFKNNHDTTRFILFVWLCFFALVGLSADGVSLLLRQSRLWRLLSQVGLVVLLGGVAWLNFSKITTYYARSLPAHEVQLGGVDTFLKQKIKGDAALEYPRFRLLLYHSLFPEYLTPYFELYENQIQLFPASETMAANTPMKALSGCYEWGLSGAAYRFRLLGLLDVRYLTSGETPIPYPLQNAALFDTRYLKKIASFPEGVVYKNRAWQPRLLLIPKATFFLISGRPDEEKTLRAIRKFVFETPRDFSQEVVLAATPSEVASFSLLSGKESAQAQITRQMFKPNTIEVEIENFSKKGLFLYLGDPYSPHWKAYDNGQKTQIFLANGIGRSVYLSAEKEHKIIFKYEIPYFFSGVFLTLLSLITALFLLIKPKAL